MFTHSSLPFSPLLLFSSSPLLSSSLHFSLSLLTGTVGGSAVEGSDNGPFGYVSFVEGSGALDMAERQAWRGFKPALPLLPLLPLSNVLAEATTCYTSMSDGEAVATRTAWFEEGESPVPPLIPSLMPIQRRSMRQTVDDVCADLISYVPSVGSSPHSNHGDLELGSQGGCIQRPVSISCCGHVRRRAILVC